MLDKARLKELLGGAASIYALPAESSFTLAF